VSQAFQIPLQPSTPQSFSIQLSGVTYTLSFVYRNDANMPGWFMDIADSGGTPIVQGLGVVTGADLLAQFGYLNFGGKLIGQTTSDPDALPTFDNFGTDFQLYWVPNS